VKKKFARAMESDVSVGEWKPTRRKIVAEKYMREFWGLVSFDRRDGTGQYLRNRKVVENLEACMR
jgi:hypothetical protein